MGLLGRLKERRQRKAHRRHVAERERQKVIQGQDTEQAIKDASVRGNVAGQAFLNPW